MQVIEVVIWLNKEALVTKYIIMYKPIMTFSKHINI